MKNEKKDMAIIVSSYDGAHKMWNNFFHIFDYYWSNCKFSIYLVNNFLVPILKNVNIINTFEEKGWKNRILTALSQIEEEYILFMFEDNFLGKKIDNREIYRILEFIKKNKIKFYQIGGVENKKYSKKCSNIIPILENERYGINLQCAIWFKKELVELIEKMEGNTPWDFENFYLKNLKNDSQKIKEGYVYDKRNIFNIQHGILHGKWVKKTIDFFRNERLEIELCDYEIRSFFEEKLIELQSVIGKILPVYLVRKLKKILKKIGFKFVSDF